jgi:hypothetical protein
MSELNLRTEDSLATEAKELAAKGEGCAMGKLLADLDVLQRFDILNKTYTKPGEEIGPDHIKITPIQNKSVTWGNEESITVKRTKAGEWFAQPELIYQESLNFSTKKHNIICK